MAVLLLVHAISQWPQTEWQAGEMSLRANPSPYVTAPLRTVCISTGSSP